MIIETTIQGNEAIVHLNGRIDTTNYNEFEQVMNQLFEKQIKHLLLDCSALEYISSSGLRVFLTARKQILALEGSFILFSLQPMIQEIFNISGFQNIFPIYPDLESAKKNRTS